MKKLLLEELENELLRLEKLFAVIDNDAGYLQGRIDELTWSIKLIKRLKQ